MPRVILYKGTSAYDAVSVFNEEFGAGLAALGREVVVVDLSDKSGRAARVQDELSRPFECIVSFSGIGFRPMSVAAGTHMYDRLSAPFVAVLVDHPSCQLDRFGIENMIITCYDRSHVAFLKKYFDGRKRVEFLPHGGSVAEGAGDEPARRAIDLLFPGTYADLDEAYATLRTALPENVFDIMDNVVERLLVTDCEPMEDALSAVLSSEGKEGDWKGLCACLPMVEAFVKPYKRMEILRCLDRAGIAVEILGKWPPELFKHHRIRPPVPYRELLRLMRRSKIVLSMGFVPDGSHERVFSAMLNGAVPASDYNHYLDELFTDGREILLFRWTQLEQMPGRLAELLSDEAKLSACSLAASEAGKAHTWAARAPSLLEFVRHTT
jgi:hypothetical protein